MKLLATVAFAAICAMTATAFPGNLTEWVGHERRNFNPDGKGRAAGLYNPAGLVTDGKHFYLAEKGNKAVRNITLDGTTTVMAGGMPQTYVSNGPVLPPTVVSNYDGYWNETSINDPEAIAMSLDNTTIAVAGINTGVHVFDLATANSTVKGGSSQSVTGLAFDANNTLWYSTNYAIYAHWRVSDFGANEHNVHRVYGTESSGYSDGFGLDALFLGIGDIQMHFPDPQDTSKTMIIVADSTANTIRGIHTGNNSVVTLAGVPGSASFQDGPRGIGMLSSPGALTIPMRGKAKHAYVAMSSVIRRLDLVNGDLTTIAGLWNRGGLVYDVDPRKVAFGSVGGMVEHDNRLYLSLSDFNTIATLELNHTEEFVGAAVSPSAGVVAVAAALVASLLL